MNRKSKALEHLLPLIALIIGAVWIIARWPETTQTEEQAPRLEMRVAGERQRTGEAAARIQEQSQAIAAGEPHRTRATASGPAKPKSAKPKTPKEIWAPVEELLGEGEWPTVGPEDMPFWPAFAENLKGKTRQELLTLLGQLDSFELDVPQKAWLEVQFVEPMAAVDPELAVTSFSKFLPENFLGKDTPVITDFGMNPDTALSDAFEAWATKNRAAALAWFDREIAAGTFDSTSLEGNVNRLRFERAIHPLLQSSDPKAAAARLEALPEHQRQVIEGDSTQAQP